MEFVLNLKRIFIIAFFLVAMGNSYSLFGQNCPQNNFNVANFQLRDENGNLFSTTDDYEIGETVNGELWVLLGGASENGYSLRFYYSIFKTNDDGTSIENSYVCLFQNSLIIKGTWVKVRDLSWEWGDIIEIKNLRMEWDTNSGETSPCTWIDRKSQCFTNPEGYIAEVPLFPKFDFVSNGICNTTIQFSSQTIGGTPPYNYTFLWDFDGLGTDTFPNPVFNFPSSGTYTIGLTANDGTSITTIYKDIFIDPNFGIQVDILPTKINDSSGIIYVQSVTGGTPPYSYSWTGPNGFTSTSKDIFNLSNGLYTLTVTDANGCTQTVSYELDIANVLGFSWRSLEVRGDKSKIEICWEVSLLDENCTFEIQRSSGDISNFTTIGIVQGIKSTGSPQTFHFTDHSIPAFESTFYYRIVKKSEMMLNYSPVKMFKKEGPQGNEKSWMVFPNPSIGKDVFLKYLGKADSSQKGITIDLFNSGIHLESVSFETQLSNPINLKDLFPNFPKGHLILRIQLDNEVEVIQLIN